MLRVVIALLTVGITLYAFVDCLRCGDDEVRRWPRHVWCLITLIPLVGGIAWLAYGGRPENGNRPVPRPSAPDDDPEFLRSLDQSLDHPSQDDRDDARPDLPWEPGSGDPDDRPDRT
jgi:hypothetical protein